MPEIPDVNTFIVTIVCQRINYGFSGTLSPTTKEGGGTATNFTTKATTKEHAVLPPVDCRSNTQHRPCLGETLRRGAAGQHNKPLDSFHSSAHVAAMNHVGGNRFSARKWEPSLGLLLCAFLVGISCQIRAAADTAKTFKLRGVSVFDGSNEPFVRGQMCLCQDNPFTEVKGYPKFASRAPIFGRVRFGAKFNQTNAGVLYYFAVDESRGTGQGYDRFYFDANWDLDLRNDPVAKLQPIAPDQGYNLHFYGIKSRAAFDFLKVNLAADGSTPDFVELMPRLLVTAYDKQTYCWRVPDNLKLDGSKETFTLQVVYDTLEPYGKVTASRPIAVYRE